MKIKDAQKFKLVNEKFHFKKIKPIRYKNLTYKEKLYLLAIIRIMTDEEFDKILPLNNKYNSKNLSPNTDMDHWVIESLITKDVILVNPNSNIDAFNFEEFKCTGFNIDEVSMIVNVSNENGKKHELKEFYRLLHLDLTTIFTHSLEEKNQIFSFTMNLALNEVESYLLYKISEFNYKFEIGTKTHLAIYQLLNYLSVSEIYDIVDIAVDNDYLQSSRKKSQHKLYGKSIAVNLFEIGESAIRNKHSLTKANRIPNLPRSELSKVFYELIHKVNDKGFYECPVKYWNEYLSQIY